MNNKSKLSSNDLAILKEIAGVDLQKLERLIVRRQNFHEPMAYIRGYFDFCNLTFKIDRRAYVSAPDTSIMVEALQEYIVNNCANLNPKILDVGTGCGNIAITLKKNLANACLFASDLIPACLELASENAMLHNVDVVFYESSYVDSLPDLNPDFIISCLCWGSEDYLLPTNNLIELRQMPASAIFHPAGVLTAYVELLESVKKRGWNPKIFLETGIMPQAIIIQELGSFVKTIDYHHKSGYSFCIVTV
jgi:release factor glutamine methyltransferase